MGRRKVEWRRKARQASDVSRAIPGARVTGKGRWGLELEANRHPAKSIGRTVTEPMGLRKRQLVEKWASAK